MLSACMTPRLPGSQVMGGSLVAPEIPEVVERVEMESLVDTYGDYTTGGPKAVCAIRIDARQGNMYTVADFARAYIVQFSHLHMAHTGKTFHMWQYDRGDTLPLGPPQLMMSFTQVCPDVVMC